MKIRNSPKFDSSIDLLKYFAFFVHFLCSPKENEPKERAPCAPLLPALLEPGGALSNSPRPADGAQTAKGPFPPASAMLGAGRWVTAAKTFFSRLKLPAPFIETPEDPDGCGKMWHPVLELEK
jgi:hypothetical protein